MSTIIKKHSKTAFISQPVETGYREHNPTFDPITLNDLIKDIDFLDEESHEKIYLLLRGFKPASFFTTDRGMGGTHFDRSLLTDRQLNDLYHIVQLCKENIKRKDIIQSAKLEHENVMSGLSANLNIKLKDEL